MKRPRSSIVDDRDDNDRHHHNDDSKNKRPFKIMKPNVKKSAGTKTKKTYEDTKNEKGRSPVTSAPKTKTLFQFWKKDANGSTPPKLGLKDIPKGNHEECLLGLTFVITGTLESLPRDQAKAIIESYKGRVTGSLSSKTTHLLSGSEAGPAKTKKANDLGIKIIDEDGLFELLKTRSPPTLTKKQKAAQEKHEAKTKERQEKLIAKVSAKVNTPDNINVHDLDSKKHSSVLTSKRKDLTWVEKYRPTTVDSIIGHEATMKTIRNFVKGKTMVMPKTKTTKGKTKVVRNMKTISPSEVKTINKSKTLCVFGAPGQGKTLMCELIMRSENISIIRVQQDSNGMRTPECFSEVERRVRDHYLQCAFFSAGLKPSQPSSSSGSNIIVFLDDLQSWYRGKKMSMALRTFIDRSSVPILMTCTKGDYNKSLSTFRKNYCTECNVTKVSAKDIAVYLAEVAKREGIVLSVPQATQLAESCQSDFRQCLGRLQLYHTAIHNVPKSKIASIEIAKSTLDYESTGFNVLPQLFLPVANIDDNPQVVKYNHGNTVKNKKSWVRERLDMIFACSQSDLIPLFIHDHYIQSSSSQTVTKNVSRSRRLQDTDELGRLADASDCIVDGDILNKSIYTQGNRSLTPTYYTIGAILPGVVVKRSKVGSLVTFPSIYAKDAKIKKQCNETQIIRERSYFKSDPTVPSERHTIPATLTECRFLYYRLIYNRFMSPLHEIYRLTNHKVCDTLSSSESSSSSDSDSEASSGDCDKGSRRSNKRRKYRHNSPLRYHDGSGSNRTDTEKSDSKRQHHTKKKAHKTKSSLTKEEQIKHHLQATVQILSSFGIYTKAMLDICVQIVESSMALECTTFGAHISFSQSLTPTQKKQFTMLFKTIISSSDEDYISTQVMDKMSKHPGHKRRITTNAQDCKSDDDDNDDDSTNDKEKYHDDETQIDIERYRVHMKRKPSQKGTRHKS